jgi:hypothetical protein
MGVGDSLIARRGVYSLPMKPLPALALALLCVGCEGFQARQKPQAGAATAPAPATNARFVVYSSAGETFLVNSETGKVWRYDAKDKAFLEVPVTGKIILTTITGIRWNRILLTLGNQNMTSN